MDEPDTPEQLKARALRHLVRREHSRAELARKLAPFAESEQCLAAVLDLLLSKRQQSDERFASERARVLSRKFGPAKIRQDLKARGIEATLVERLAAGTDDVQAARTILARRFPAQASSAQERARRMRFLQGRGFSYETIHRALRDRPDDAAS
jgi:regulatory protein